MLWTAEAVEDLKRLAHEGRSASHIAAALGAGSGSSSVAAGGAPPRLTRRRPARVGPNGRPCLTPSPTLKSKARPLAVSRPGRGGRPHGLTAKPISERCGGCVSRTFANPHVGGRSAIREAEISPIAGSRRPTANPIAPAIAEWLTDPRTRDRSRASDKGSAPSQ